VGALRKGDRVRLQGRVVKFKTGREGVRGIIVSDSVWLNTEGSREHQVQFFGRWKAWVDERFLRKTIF